MKLIKSFLAAALSAVMLAATVVPAIATGQPVGTETVYEPEYASPLIVTEVVPTGPASTRYTYTEIYNNSTSDINFKDYTFYYRYPSGGGQTWTTGGQDVIIESGKCLVLWQSDLKYPAKTVDDFNEYYGVNLVENKDIFRINYSGIHQTDRRGFLFGRDADTIIAEAWCNEDGADIPSADRGKKLGVHYTYPRSGVVSTKIGVSKATPGSVDPSQVPEQKVELPDAAPSVKSVNAPSTVAADQPFTVTAAVEGLPGAMKVNLWYKQKEDVDFQRIEMTRTPGTKDYTVSVDRSLLWNDSITWYVEASYGAGLSNRTQEAVSQIEYSPVDADKAAPLVVTEVNCAPGTGQFSYVEIYNRTDSPINYGYYKIFYYYNYPNAAADKTWSISQPDVIIQPGDTLVLWLSSNGTTVDQFNEFYGTNLVEDKDIVRINYAGLHASAKRSVRLGYSEDTAFVLAEFNENGADTPAGSGNSIKYTYPRTEDNTCIKVSTNTAWNPGVVEDWQVPKDFIPFRGYDNYPADNGYAPLVELDGEVPASINEGEELFTTFTVDSLKDTSGNPKLTCMTVNYRLDGQGDFQRIAMTSQRVAGKFFARIPSDVLFGHDSVEFFVENFNLYRTTKSETYQVKINRINDVDGVRLSVQDGSVLGGTQTITANNGKDNADTQILVDGQPAQTVPVLENGAYFAVTCGGWDNYFKNALTAPYGDNSREIIDFFTPWGATPTSRVTKIDNKYFTYEDGVYKVKLTMWAGTSGTPFEETLMPGENHEDYTVTNLQLRLANGKSYLPVKIEPDNEKTNTSTDYDAIHTIGDSSGMVPHMDIFFEIPASEVTAVGVQLDTNSLSDGEHTVTAVSGGATKEAKVIVDNTLPQIDLGIPQDSTVYNTLTIEPVITDATRIVQSSVILDGEQISTPYSVPARTLTPGSHTLTATAMDEAGNLSTKTITFQTEAVDPSVSDTNSDGITDHSANLSVSLADGPADVTFLQGRSLTLANGGITVTDAEESAPVTIPQKNGDPIEVTAPNGEFPYQLFTVSTGQTGPDDQLSVTWNGSASNVDAEHPIGIYALNLSSNTWDLVGSAAQSGSVQASFSTKDHVADGKAVLLVQSRTSGTSPEISAASVQANADNTVWDGTDRPENYDFSFAWITDTQYYCESYPHHFTNMNQWIVDNAEEWKIRYTLHTGDIVDEFDMTGQWKVADRAMKIFDDAGMPYGVLGGNHDVYAGAEGYGNYWNYFGEDRFKSQPTYGGSYKNNLGHYDLLTENGQDIIVLYMSWDIYQDEIDWMNQVLAQYSDRKAIIALHRYANVKMADNLLDYTGKLLKENVVAQNPNVIAVLNGHYHGASIQTDGFDDNGDGVNDRVVYQICTDYQSDPEGGSEYIKFLYFDLANDKIYVNSYSPYRNDFNYFDTPRLDSYGEGAKAVNMDIYELPVDFDTTAKTLSTTSMTVDVQTQNVIGRVTGASETAEYLWEGLQPSTEYGWYARVTNSKGGETVTPVTTFVTDEAVVPVTYTVTASAGAGGSISNAGSTQVAQGGSITFTVMPDSGFRVCEVLLDGSPVELTDGKLTLTDVQADHIIEVRFEKVPVTETADKTILDKVIARAQELLGTEEYANAISDVKATFDQALGEAVAVQGDASADQQAVDAAWIKLMGEIHKLGLQQGNKEQLIANYELYSRLDLNLYLDGEAKENFKLALAQAKEVIDSNNALQAEVDAANTNLVNAAMVLVKRADKHLLETLVATASGYAEEDFVAEGWADFAQALETANSLLADEAASQDQVDATYNALLEAMLQLRYKADKSILSRLVTSAKQIDLTGYSVESVSAFQSALADAETTLADQSLSTREQGVVDSAVEALRQAIHALTDGQGNSPDISVAGDGSLTQANRSPKTGDAAPTALALTLLLTAAAVAFTGKKKQQ